MPTTHHKTVIFLGDYLQIFFISDNFHSSPGMVALISGRYGSSGSGFLPSLNGFFVFERNSEKMVHCVTEAALQPMY